MEEIHLLNIHWLFAKPQMRAINEWGAYQLLS